MPFTPFSPIKPIYMINRKPEGYKELLAYQKAAALQAATFELTRQFPKTKTLIALADQMDRSARSGTKNIIEGWKRNTTREYFQFLGFSIGSTEEVKDDAADIAKGLYRELMTIRELWVPRGEMGVRGGMGGKGEMGGMGEKGVRGEKGVMGGRGIMGERGSGMGGMGVRGEKGVMGGRGETGEALNPIQPIQPIPPISASPPVPFTPFKPFTESELVSLRFYPLDHSLPPIVQLYLRAKEVLMLLNKLQKSLDVKMDQELTKSPQDRARKRILQFEKENRDIKKMIEDTGLRQLEDGRWVKRE